MKETENNIAQLFRNDTILLGVFLAIACLVMTYAFIQIIDLVPFAAVHYLIIVVLGVSVVAMTWAVTAVLHHLKKHKDQIYREDLRCMDQIAAQKRHPHQVIQEQEVETAS